MNVGLDTNILCYILDPVFPENKKAARLLSRLAPDFIIALNPTVVHETYHTLVYGQKWTREDARLRLGLFLKHPYVAFHNQTKAISLVALRLAESYSLGGRDSLILSNFLSNKVPTVYTRDHDLLRLGSIEWRGSRCSLEDPLGPALPVRRGPSAA